MIIGLRGLAAAAVLLAAQPAAAATGDRLDRAGLGPLSFEETFDAPPSFYHPTENPSGRWKTTYRHGWQADDVPAGIERRTLQPNKELQVYTDRWLGPDPFSWADGVLSITARPAADPRRLWGQRYTSGMISTEKSFAQRYGYWEMRGQVPKGKGLWSAFWLLKTDAQAPNWPPELDILEAHGDKPRTHFMTAHSKDARGRYRKDFLAYEGADLTAGPHTFGLLWTPEALVWYQDDVEQYRVATPPGFDAPMHLIVNLAVGGEWPGSPDAATQFPAALKVDHVRVWRLGDGRD